METDQHQDQREKATVSMKGNVTKREGGTGAGKLRSLTGLQMALNRLATMGSHSHLQEEERKPIGHLCKMEQGNLLEAEAREGEGQAGTEPPGVPVLSHNK